MLSAVGLTIILRSESLMAGPAPALYQDTEPLTTAWAQDGTRSNLLENLKGFFGSAKGKYIDLRRFHDSISTPTLLYSQFSLVFSGVPAPAKMTADGNRILMSTMPANSSEAAMVVTSGVSNTIVATALLHYFCGKYNDGSYKSGMAPNCARTPTLTIFYSGDVAPNQNANQDLIDWTKSYLKLKLTSSTTKVGPRKFTPQIRQLK